MENFVQDLKNQIMEELRVAYGDAAFNRWLNPKYLGEIENPDGYAQLTGPCGDKMEVFLKIDEDRVMEASFKTEGCGASSVCGSYAAEMALGKTPKELFELSGTIILKELIGLPEEEKHLAHIAAEAIRDAAKDYLSKKSR